MTIDAELNSLKANGTYKEVATTAGVIPVKFKWVFRCKTHPDGLLSKYNARLAAKMFTQSYGADNDKTFGPAAHHDSIRTVLATAVDQGCLHRQMDVQTAFLNSELAETM